MEPALGEVAECRSSCVPESTAPSMSFTKGREDPAMPGKAVILSFTSEANIASAMRTFGALYCTMDMFASCTQAGIELRHRHWRLRLGSNLSSSQHSPLLP